MLHFADLAPHEMPDIEYTRVNAEQAACIARAMELAENQALFQVSFLPVGTPEERQAAADEWASYEQAKGDTQARDRGAVMVIGGVDRSPDALARSLEDLDEVPIIPFKPFATHALLKVVKTSSQTSTFDLLKEYYAAE